MIAPRWHKVLNDLRKAKARTALVVLSIAIGVFAIGVVTQTFNSVQETLALEYPRGNPASASLTTDGFDDDLLQTVRHMQGIGDVTGRTQVGVRVRVGSDLKQLLLYVIPDFEHVTINKLFPEKVFAPNPNLGAERTVWPPPDRAMLVERSSFLIPGLAPTGTQVGDKWEIQTPDGQTRYILFAGLAHEPTQIPATFAGAAYGYINRETLNWLIGTRVMNQLSFVVSEGQNDKAHIVKVADQVRAKVENSGRTVYVSQVPDPNKSPLQDIFTGLLLILNILGVASLFLSGFLIVNTLSALLMQQTRQIGVMKSLGARQGQIIAMYLVTVLVYGLLALLIAAPASAFVSNVTIRLLSGFVNVDPPPFRFVPEIIVVQAAIALVFPLVIAIFPVLGGTRLTVYQAITDYGIGHGPQKPGLMDRVLNVVRILPRPILLSLRNTFRRKARLALTLTTLILAGAIFIGVFSTREALLVTLDDALKYWQFDILFAFSRAYRSELVQQTALEVPGVVQAETWGLDFARRVRPDDSETEPLRLFAPPTNTTMLNPTMMAGRWLLPDDENALVVSNGVANAERDIKVGDEIKLNIRNKKSTWRVVGIARVIGNFGSSVGNVYMNYPYYARLVGEVGRAGSIQLVTDQHDAAYQDQIQKQVEARLKAQGVRTAQAITSGSLRAQNELFFNIIVYLLLIMAILMAAVGGLGLMGTMSLNVLERTREIGVMRAIGASDGAIRWIVLVEGIMIGAISWVVGALLAVPFGKLMTDGLGQAIFQVPIAFAVSMQGMVIWLIVVSVISVLASLGPAQGAARLTVREVLAYE